MIILWGWLRALTTLTAREIYRFFRQKGRVIGALGAPLMFWILLGLGFGEVGRFFPGALVMVVLFTAIFSSISIIEDRHEGFLQGVLVAPVPRLLIVLGKVLGGSLLACMQGLPFLLLSPLVGFSLSLGAFFSALGILFLMALALSAVGFFFAWRLDSVQGFHGIMNLVLFPMWLLSGAFFPLEGASPIMQWVMRVNPLTYGLDLLLGVLHPELSPAGGDPLGWVVIIGFVGIMLLLCVREALRPEKR